MQVRSLSSLLCDLIKQEAQQALGCTEPVMVALTAAHASRLAGEAPLAIEVSVGQGVLKNGRAVGLPGTKRRGLDVAAALGAACARPEDGLAVLRSISPAQRETAERLVDTHRVSVKCAADSSPVFASVTVTTDSHTGTATIEGSHTNVACLLLDGRPVTLPKCDCSRVSLDTLSGFSFEELYDNLISMDMSDLSYLAEGARENLSLADRVLRGECPEVSPQFTMAMRKIFSIADTGLVAKVHLHTAAAVAARMNGVEWPVLTCAGSGNQGLLVTIPILLAAQDLFRVSEDEAGAEKVLRALVIAHAVNLYLKSFSGELSALCGAVTGGAGVAAAVCWLSGGQSRDIGLAIRNHLSNLCGMVCDGAKESCALKIACGASEGLISGLLGSQGVMIEPGRGIAAGSVEETAKRLGNLVKSVLNRADAVILEDM
jgi:L-cysteine desulfidase